MKSQENIKPSADELKRAEGVITGEQKKGNTSGENQESETNEVFVENGVAYGPVSRIQKSEAVALVVKEYKRNGLITSEEQERETREKLLGDKYPDIIIFCAEQNGKIIGTMSLVLDSPNGLPSDSIHEDELNELRDQNLKFAEVTGFAFDEDVKSQEEKSIFDPITLIKVILAYAMYIQLDGLAISIHPKRKKFYKLLNFNEMGGVKQHMLYSNAPAQFMYLDINYSKAKIRQNNIKNPLWRKVLSNSPLPETLAAWEKRHTPAS